MSVRTLAIASIASAMAAVVTSQFWIAGTPIAAALTPVIVTLVSELLQRPTQKIVERLTTETDAPGPETDALPEAAGAGPPPREEEYHPSPAREPRPGAPLGREPSVSRAPGRETPRGPGRGAPDYRVYRSGPVPSRGLPWKPILLTAALAFTLAAAALTLPELIAGQSVGRGDRNFTLFGGESRDNDEGSPKPAQTQPEQTQPGSQATPPDETVPSPEPELTAPAEPEATPPSGQTTPAPGSGTPAPSVP